MAQHEIPEPDDDARARLAEALDELKARFLTTTATRLAPLEAAAAAAATGALDAELRARARKEAHRLAGSLGTFGYPESSRRAARIEALLEAPGSLAPEAAAELDEAFRALRAELSPPES